MAINVVANPVLLTWANFQVVDASLDPSGDEVAQIHPAMQFPSNIQTVPAKGIFQLNSFDHHRSAGTARYHHFAVGGADARAVETPAGALRSGDPGGPGGGSGIGIAVRSLVFGTRYESAGHSPDSSHQVGGA
jgi:hypothetical protein